MSTHIELNSALIIRLNTGLLTLWRSPLIGVCPVDCLPRDYVNSEVTKPELTYISSLEHHYFLQITVPPPPYMEEPHSERLLTLLRLDIYISLSLENGIDLSHRETEFADGIAPEPENVSCSLRGLHRTHYSERLKKKQYPITGLYRKSETVEILFRLVNQIRREPSLGLPKLIKLLLFSVIRDSGVEPAK